MKFILYIYLWSIFIYCIIKDKVGIVLFLSDVNNKIREVFHSILYFNLSNIILFYLFIIFVK